MKLKTINYFYEFAHVVFYLRYYDASDKYIFNDKIRINKHCKPLRVYNNYHNFISLSLKIYKNTTLDFILSPKEAKEFYHEVALSII